MDSLFDLLIVAFVLMSMLGSLFKKRGAGVPPAPPPRRPRAPQPEERPRTAAPPEESAADMIPDELWVILTGERRAPAPVPVPAPTPRPGAEYSEEEEEEETDAGWLEAAEAESYTAETVLASRESAPGESYPWETREPEVERTRSLEVYVPPERPVIISLEEESREAARKRRAAAAAATAARLAPPPPRPAPRSRLGLASAADLRRAIILREVLGTPKGWE